jgi:hypothetical protein
MCFAINVVTAKALSTNVFMNKVSPSISASTMKRDSIGSQRIVRGKAGLIGSDTVFQGVVFLGCFDNIEMELWGSLAGKDCFKTLSKNESCTPVLRLTENLVQGLLLWQGHPF